MTEASDAAVVARVRDGDTEAFRLLVERHGRGLFHLAWRMTGSEPDAEDIVQETFLKAYRSLDGFEPRGSFTAWLYRIAANTALDLARSRRRQGVRAEPKEGEDGVSHDPVASLPAGDPDADRLVSSGEVRRRVKATMSRLSPNERAAFVLRHFDDRSIEEIGALLGLNENAAKQSIFRAVRKLRRALEPLVAPAKAAE